MPAEFENVRPTLSDPGRKLIAITLDAPLPEPARFLWVEADGTLNVILADETDPEPFVVSKGPFPFAVKQINSGGVAGNVKACK